jgi:hypothetical protein
MTSTKLCESILGLPSIQPQPSNPDWRRKRPSLSQQQKIVAQRIRRRERIQTLLRRRWKNGRIISSYLRNNPDDSDFLATIHTAVAVAYAVLPESMMELPTTTITTTEIQSTTTAKQRRRAFRIGILLKQDSIHKFAQLAKDTFMESFRDDTTRDANKVNAERIHRSILDTPLYLILLYHVPSLQEREQYCKKVFLNGKSISCDVGGNVDSTCTVNRVNDTISQMNHVFGAFLREHQEDKNNHPSHVTDATTATASGNDEMMNWSWALAACQNLRLFWRSQGYVCMVQQPDYIFTRAFHQLVHAHESEGVAAILKIGICDPHDRASKDPFGFLTEEHGKFWGVIDVS